MPNTPPMLVASGNIYPSRFVKVSDEYKGAQAGANERVIGISRDGTDYPPLEGDSRVTVAGYHAIAGEPIQLLGDGEIGLLELGGSVSAGNRLKSDGDGKGVAIATTGNAVQEVGAVALEDGVSGELIKVQVQIGATYIPT